MAKRERDSGSPDPKKIASRQPIDGEGIIQGAGCVQARLAEIGCDPFTILANIAMDKTADTRLRLYAAKELAAYILIKPHQTKAMPTGSVDVAQIIADAWRRPPGREDGGGAPAVGQPAARKADNANSGSAP